jgi:signal peptidase
MRRRLGTLARRAAGLATGLAVLGAAAYGALLLAGFHPAVVYSGSMEPTLHVGSVVFVKSVPADEIQAGDVVTFGDPYQPGRLVTHRIVEVLERPEGGLAYRTKGDANTERDPWTVSLPDHAGRLAFDVPYVGYALWYAKTREARTLLLALIAALTLAALLRRIWRAEAAPEPVPPAISPAPAAPRGRQDESAGGFWLEALRR